MRRIITPAERTRERVVPGERARARLRRRGDPKIELTIALGWTDAADARLEVEKDALAADLAAVAGHRPIGADHAMAGDHDRQRVAAVGGADGAAGGGPADRAGELAVARRLAVRDREQSRPHGALERRPARRERQVEARPLPGEVFGELRGGRAQAALVAHPARRRRREQRV